MAVRVESMGSDGQAARSSTPQERTEALVPLIEEHAAAGEQERRLAQPVVDALLDRGLLHLYVPQSLGGEEVDPLTIFEVIERISRADGSTGWVSMILNGAFMSAWLDPAVAKSMVDDQFLLAGTFGPLGRAVPTDDGFAVTGRWPFNSGSVHAGWMLGGVFVMGDEGPVMVPPGRPDWRFAMFPSSECELHDTWHAAGLRATSSHDISVDAVSVPAELMIAPLFEPARHDGPLWRFSFFALLATMMVGVPLGIARRALDDTVELCKTKSRGPNPPLIEDGTVQIDLVRCEASLRSARALVVDAIGEAWEAVAGGDRLGNEHRVALRMATLHAAEVGVTVVDRCFRLGGGGALYDTSPLQRCWRDLHAATHHIFFSDMQLRETASLHLGLSQDSIFL